MTRFIALLILLIPGMIAIAGVKLMRDVLFSELFVEVSKPWPPVDSRHNHVS